MPFVKIASFAVLSLLIACAPTDPIEAQERKAVAECENALPTYQVYVGQKYGDVEFPDTGRVKVHQSGMDENGVVYVSTMEASAGRLQVYLDENEIITSITCEQAIPRHPVS